MTDEAQPLKRLSLVSDDFILGLLVEIARIVDRAMRGVTAALSVALWRRPSGAVLSCTGSISEAPPVLVAAAAARFTKMCGPGSAEKTRPWGYDAGRKVCRVYHGFEVTPISCSEPSNSGESFGPEALN